MGFKPLNVDAHEAEWRCPTCRLAARARNGLLSMPNNPLIVAAVQAICAGGSHAQLNEAGWRRDRNGAPVFEFWNGAGGRIKVYIDAAPEQAWADVAAFSTLTLDCAVGVLTCLAADPFRAATAAPRCGHVWIGTPALLFVKGYKRFGAERIAFADVIDIEIARLMRLRFDIVAYPAFDPLTRKWSGAGISRAGLTLFEAAPDAGAPDSYDCERGKPLRFGAWSQHWLNAGGAMWVSPMPEAILHLDHRSNRGPDALAKKIGVILALNWGASRKKRTLSVDVRALLRRVGELRRPGTPNAHAGRVADRLEEALLRLSELGVFPSRFAGESAAAMRASNRHWFEAWCEAEVVFDCPSFLESNADSNATLGA